jgi:type III pantothenate kinase
MLFAIDIGNTNIHIGFFDNDKLEHTFRLGSDKNRTSDEYAYIMRSISVANGFDLGSFEAAIIGSVAPALTGTIQSAVRSILNVPIINVGPGIKTGFPLKIDSPSELGADLASNAAGAIAKYGSPAIVIDFGTASVISVIDENGAYVGGAIMPGVQMSLDALQNTGLLPGIPPEDAVPLLGKNTKDCMSAGAIRGAVYSAMGFVNEYKQNLFAGKEVNLVVCGGFAKYTLPYLPKETKHAPNLTLEGLNTIYKFNKNKVIPRVK